ncbi:hypothetical protein MHU86_10290 [Fragilaria crotonensis]|nr:hypothetical protein MHU86_10290 [Fragilaria crotonensis]
MCTASPATSRSTPSHAKVVSLAKEALAKLPSLKGITIAVGGFGLGGKPETLLDELCNDDSVSDLTKATLTGGVPGQGLGKLIEDGKVELTPQGTLAQRLFSAGAGIPDNPRFYRELKSFTVNGEGWPYIKKFERSQDGQKAYLALKTQCEGTASKITRKNRAYASIANATYTGSRRQFKFQDYIKTHQTAYYEILDCDPTEAVPESKKISYCQQYLLTTVENRATLEKSKEQNISGLKSRTDKSDKKKGEKGRPPNSSVDDATGKEFGRGAHKKKSKKDNA